jgi:hypothetical protein
MEGKTLRAAQPTELPSVDRSPRTAARLSLIVCHTAAMSPLGSFRRTKNDLNTHNTNSGVIRL